MAKLFLKIQPFREKHRSGKKYSATLLLKDPFN